MSCPTFEEVVDLILSDRDVILHYKVIEIKDGRFIATVKLPLRVSTTNFRSDPSCCELCACNNCARKVYVYLSECHMIRKKIGTGEDIPLPCDDYFCLSKVAIYGRTHRERYIPYSWLPIDC